MGKIHESIFPVLFFWSKIHLWWSAFVAKWFEVE